MKKIEDLQKLAKAGQFSKVLELCTGADLDDKSSLNILKAISNACYHHGNTCEIASLTRLCNRLMENINTIEERSISDYVRVAFHIVNLLYNKEQYGELSTLETLLVPNFLTPQLTTSPAVKGIYENIPKLLLNSLNRTAQAKSTNSDIMPLMQIVRLILRTQRLLGSAPNLCSIAHKCYLLLKTLLQVTNEQLLSFYGLVLELYMSLGHQHTDTDATASLLAICSNILTDFITQHNFDLCDELLFTAESHVTKHTYQTLLKSHSIFEAITILFPSKLEHLQDNVQNTKTIMDAVKTINKQLFYKISYYINAPLLSLLEYYKKAGAHVWCHLPKTCISQFLKYFIEELQPYIIAVQRPCNCGCIIMKNYEGALVLGGHFTALLKMYIQETSSDLSRSCLSSLTKSHNYYFNLVKHLKNKNCQKWTQLYRVFMVHAYNIGTALYKAKNNACLDLSICFLSNVFEIEGTELEEEWAMLVNFQFVAACETYFRKNDFVNCLAVAALYCLLYPSQSITYMKSWWIKGKAASKETNDQLTIVSVLQQQAKQLSNIINIETMLSLEKRIELLNIELNFYKLSWKSNAAMMTAVVHLFQIADIPAIAAAVLQIYGDGDCNIHQDTYFAFTRVIKNMEQFLEKGSKDPKVKLAIAVMRYYNFKKRIEDTVSDNCKEMERTMQVLNNAKSGENIEAVPKDANDECDIVSAYSNLRLSKFMDNLKQLNSSREIISELTNQDFDLDLTKNIASLLIRIGFEYRLHWVSLWSTHCFYMAMKWAEKAAHKEAQLLALGFIIEYADVENEVVISLISKGDELVKVLKEREDCIKALITYHICKSKAFLYVNRDKSYASWQIADDLYQPNKENNKLKILGSELKLILYKLTRDCSFIPGEHEREPMTLKLHYALDLALKFVKTIPPTAHDLSILFDTAHELAKTYKLMRLPRDLRAYSKNVLVLAQKLVVPLRAVSLLIILAHSDLFTVNLDHCTVKLNGIDTILCLNYSMPTTTSIENVIATMENERKQLMENEVDQCSDLMKELLLDKPQYFRQLSPGSPSLSMESFKYPTFLAHCKSCHCLMCVSVEFQQLLLQKYHLNALINVYEKESKVAGEFFTGALQIYDRLRQSYSDYRDKASNFVASALVSQFEEFFLESYCSILYEYSFHLSRESLKEDGMKINTLLVQLLKPKKFRYTYLYHDALLQRAGYIVQEKEKKILPLEEEESDKIDVISIDPPKTPISKMVPVTVMVNGVPSDSISHRAKLKKSQLFVDTPEVKPRKTKASTKPKTNGAPTFLVPNTGINKTLVVSTPTPVKVFPVADFSKIQIFADDQTKPKTYSARKTNRRHKTVCSESDATETHEDVALRPKQQPSKSVSDFESLKSASTASGEATYIRAQRLTQKIKESNSLSRIKQETDKIIVEGNPGEPHNGDSSLVPESPEAQVAKASRELVLAKMQSSVKKRITKAKQQETISRKNLLHEFEEAGPSSSSGAVRRSARNRIL